MPPVDQDQKCREVLKIGDSLLQDLQGLLLRLHTTSDEFRGLLDRVDGVLAEARERLGAAAQKKSE